MGDALIRIPQAREITIFNINAYLSSTSIGIFLRNVRFARDGDDAIVDGWT
jgi:hypothetical protein